MRKLVTPNDTFDLIIDKGLVIDLPIHPSNFEFTHSLSPSHMCRHTRQHAVRQRRRRRSGGDVQSAVPSAAPHHRRVCAAVTRHAGHACGDAASRHSPLDAAATHRQNTYVMCLSFFLSLFYRLFFVRLNVFHINSSPEFLIVCQPNLCSRPPLLPAVQHPLPLQPPPPPPLPHHHPPPPPPPPPLQREPKTFITFTPPQK